MKTLKKITSYLLAAAMLGGTLLPVQRTEAAVIAEFAQYGEDSTQNTSGEGTTGQTSSEQGTTGQTLSEQATSEQSTSEQATAGQTTTEQPEEQTETNSDLAVSKLSPATARVIVIDPGHCNKHPGARGNGLKEEVVVLDIAEACKEALEEYGDVIVYMTREDGSCPSTNGLGDDLLSRNNYAQFLGADFLVSMHINAGGSSGANVLTAYKSGYHDNIRKETQAFGKIVLAQLKSIGIANRGLLLRKSGTGNRYSNGSLADYYSIVRHGVLQNLPSVIIEHGYITSASDCNKFFKTKAKRQKVGQADAKAIISYFDLSKKVINGSFQEEGNATYYLNSNKKKVAGWVKEDGKWYYFDENDGTQKTGFITVGEDMFYLKPSTGEMITGWFTVDGNKYLAKGNGTLVRNQMHSDGKANYLFDSKGRQLKKGLHTLEGYTYYVNSKKNVVTGVQKVSGKYYLFDTETGRMLYGYQKQSGKYYYLDPDTGVMARKKIVEIDGAKYYFGSNGVRVTGWVSYQGSKYYFNNTSGKMTTGWKKINGKYYYFAKSTGKMQKNKWIGNYYVNSKGVRTKKK